MTPTFLKLAIQQRKEWKRLRSLWDRPEITELTEFGEDSENETGYYSWGVAGSGSHCGTSELTGLHIADLTLQRIVEDLCCTITKGEEGHFLYFRPHDPAFNLAEERITTLGGEKLYSFQHLGYVKREPDHGWTDLWKLEFSPADREKLKEIRQRK